MKVKVINKNTNQQFDCEEIEINDFKYYILDTAIGCKYGISKLNQVVEVKISYDATLYKGIICSTNPNIDVPQILEEPNGTLINQIAADLGYRMLPDDLEEGIKAGYKESQETHPFSDEDMIEFAEWVDNMGYRQVANGLYKSINDEKGKLTKELLQLWKEQQPKIVYYG